MNLGKGEFWFIKVNRSKGSGIRGSMSTPHHHMNYEEKIEQLAELNEEAIVFHNIEPALIGWVRRFGMEPIAVYDYEKTIECLAKDHKDDEDAMEAAVEWFEYNTIGTWAGEGTPAFFYKFEQEETRQCHYLKRLRDWWMKTVKRITDTLSGFGR